MKRIAPRTYIDDKGRYHARYPVNGRYTWKLLKDARTKRDAIAAAQSAGEETADTFASLARLYHDAKCLNGKLEPFNPAGLAEEQRRCLRLIEYFGKTRPAHQLSIADIPKFKDWRIRQIKGERSGLRAVDKDTQTLSNIYRYGVVMKLVSANPFAQGRPRYQEEKQVRHSRHVAPASADQINAIAEAHLKRVTSEVFAWIGWFNQFTGCRISELLRCRTDAASVDESGFIEWLPAGQPGEPLGLLYYTRNKDGIDPWSVIGTEFAQMIQCFQRWHKARFPKSKWFFPGKFGDRPVTRRAVARAIENAARDLGYHHITPHGYRSFYVTKRRSDGEKDIVIAGEIGDRTATLMNTTYGNRPKVWSGRGEPLSWLPKGKLPGWLKWQDQTQKIARIA